MYYALPVDLSMLVYETPIPTLKHPCHEPRFRREFITTKDGSVSRYSVTTFSSLPALPTVPKTVFSSHKEKKRRRRKLKKEVKKYFLLPEASPKKEHGEREEEEEGERDGVGRENPLEASCDYILTS